MKYAFVLLLIMSCSHQIVREKTPKEVFEFNGTTIMHFFPFVSPDSSLQMTPKGVFIFRKKGQPDSILQKPAALKWIKTPPTEKEQPNTVEDFVNKNYSFFTEDTRRKMVLGICDFNKSNNLKTNRQ